MCAVTLQPGRSALRGGAGGDGPQAPSGGTGTRGTTGCRQSGGRGRCVGTPTGPSRRGFPEADTRRHLPGKSPWLGPRRLRPGSTARASPRQGHTLGPHSVPSKERPGGPCSEVATWPQRAESGGLCGLCPAWGCWTIQPAPGDTPPQPTSLAQPQSKLSRTFNQTWGAGSNPYSH